MRSQEVIVSITLGGQNIRIGKLWFHIRSGKQSASFAYDSKWLMHTEKFALEPALPLTEGVFHTENGMNIFGVIGDSAPDRWGRLLMRRAEAAKNVAAKTFSEIDYVLRVNDEARQGALRFSVEPSANIFLHPKDEAAIPPLIYLPKLLSATERFIEDTESVADLKLLLASGSSLGGARPKASVREQDGSLAIAKFPNKNDEFNVILWEAVALTLAKQAGINVPAWRLTMLIKKPVLIIKRFDRIKAQRLPFLSAMSLLGAQDNEQHSYLEIAYALAQHGAAPEKDIHELWRRIIFNVMIANTDDHLRNHGFMYERYQGWRLSPAYDMNPTPIEMKARVLTTSISFDDNSASLENALAVAHHFRLSHNRAHEIIEEVRQAVKQWRVIAKGIGLSKRECDRMASAFEYE